MQKYSFIFEKNSILIYLALISLSISAPLILKIGEADDKFSILLTITFIISGIAASISAAAYSEIKGDGSKELNKLKKEKQKLQNELIDAFKYIGTVNVKLEQIRAAFSNIEKCPKNKNGVEKLLTCMSEKVLGFVNVDWVFLRIIDTENSYILKDHYGTRGEEKLINCAISAKDLQAGKEFNDLQVISSTQENLPLKAYCIIPSKDISDEDKFYIRTIISQIELMYMAFSTGNNNKVSLFQQKTKIKTH